MASEAPQVRFVRCPNCRLLLMESPHVPVYSCGGCRTVLQAKARQSNNGNDTSQMPRDLPENRSEASTEVPTLNMQMDPLSTDANSREMDYGGDHSAVLCEEAPYSNFENNSHQEEPKCSEVEESSQCKENGNVKVGSTPDFQDSTRQAACIGEEAISVASAQQGRVLQTIADSCSNGVDRHASVNSSSSCQMGESAQGGVSEGVMVDGYPGNGLNGTLGTPTARWSSHASNGSISSCDEISGKRERYRLLSRRTFRNRKVSSESDDARGKDTQKVEERLVGRKVTASPDEDGSKQRSSSRYDAETSHQDAYQDSQNLYSVQNVLESSPLSRSLSTDSTFLGIPPNPNDCMELLAKVEALRHHLSRPYAGRGTGDRRFPGGGGGAWHSSCRTLFRNHESEQVFPSFCNTNVSPWCPRACGQTPIAEHRPHSSGMPCSAQSSSSSSCSCSHHHNEGYNTPLHLPSTICRMACSSHTRYRPSSSASSGCGSSDNTSDRDLVKQPRRERRQQHLKRHLRPASGGAPFVVCDSCLEVLQLPMDFLVSGSGRRHRLRCAACSKVLTFLHHGGYIVPHSGAQIDAPHISMDHVSKHELAVKSVNPSEHSLQGEPVSYSEEYGSPLSKSYSTDDEPVRPRLLSRSLGEEGNRHGGQTMGFPLHRLLGYDSARDLIYEPSDEEEGCDSTDVLRFYTSSDGGRRGNSA